MDKLRIAQQRGPQVTIFVNGRSVPAYLGESVHAALLAAGIRILRKSHSGQGRGILCGMGVCYECLVTINGRTNVRSCMTEVQANMEIETDDL
jgi:sarcosine oxidase subunit alpha